MFSGMSSVRCPLSSISNDRDISLLKGGISMKLVMRMVIAEKVIKVRGQGHDQII